MQYKLIAFTIDESCLPSDMEKQQVLDEMHRVTERMRAVVGLPVAGPLIAHRIRQGRIYELEVAAIQFEMDQIRPGLRMARRLLTYGIYERLRREDPNLAKPRYLDDKDFGIAAPDGASLCVVGISYYDAAKALQVYNGITGNNFVIPTVEESIEADGIVELAENSKGKVWSWTSSTHNEMVSGDKHIYRESNASSYMPLAEHEDTLGVRFAERT
ncbi:MAG: hypothetical protein HQ564_05920 [Candidatus Saganbacteria bacterium]|nr:hypothetical protein [Candidatus Saganbacteria bacterium]